MPKVVAKARGYFGGLIREAGEAFDIPDDLAAPKWTRPFAFGGKGDHDGDGKTGGSKPAEPPAGPIVIPADWKNGKAADRKALAKSITGEAVPTAADADRVIEAYVETTKPAAEPFADAPEPETAKVNDVQEAIGGVQPDWVDPGSKSEDI